MKFACKRQLNKILFFTLKWLKTFHLNRYIPSQAHSDIVTVLMYHGIDNNPYHDLDIGLDAFKNEITFYRQQGYEVVDLNRMNSNTNSAKLVIIFDDGHHNICPALDWLIEQHLPFSIAICPNIIDYQDYYWFDKLYYQITKYHSDKPLETIKSCHRQAISEINLDKKAHQKYIEKYGDFSSTWSQSHQLKHPVLHKNLSQQQLEHYVKSGYCSLSAHGVNHDSMNQLSEEQFKSDVTTTKTYIENTFTIDCTSYVCPFGDYKKSYQAILDACGFEYTFLINDSINFRHEEKVYHRIKGIGLSIDNYRYFQYLWHKRHNDLAKQKI